MDNFVALDARHASIYARRMVHLEHQRWSGEENIEGNRSRAAIC